MSRESGLKNCEMKEALRQQDVESQGNQVPRERDIKSKKRQEHDASRERYWKDMLREKDAKRKANQEEEMSRGSVNSI